MSGDTDMDEAMGVLGLSRDTATLADARRAFHRKALAVHPDKRRRGEDSVEHDGKDFAALSEAYEIVRSGLSRASAMAESELDVMFDGARDVKGGPLRVVSKSARSSVAGRYLSLSSARGSAESGRGALLEELEKDRSFPEDGLTARIQLCPFCLRPATSGRAMRAHLMSSKHKLRDEDLDSAIRRAEAGACVEASVKGIIGDSDGIRVSLSVKRGHMLSLVDGDSDKATIDAACQGKQQQKKTFRRVESVMKGARTAAAAALGRKVLKRKRKLHPILEACRDGREDVVRGILSGGETNIIDCVDHNGSSAFCWAAGSGHLGVLELLLKGCSSHRPCELLCLRDKRSGRHCLHWAARNGHVHIIDFILASENSSKSLVDDPTLDGTTPFQLAAYGGYIPACEFLLSSGCNIHAENSFGCNALHFSALSGNSIPMMRWLVSSGVDIRAVQNRAHNCLHKAAWAGNRRVCDYLQDEIGLDVECREVDEAGHTASRLAQIAGHDDLARHLLRHREANSF